MSHSGDMPATSIGGSNPLKTFVNQCFTANFHFLNNDKSQNRDFFTTCTIDDGLSFGAIKSISSSDNFYMVPHTMNVIFRHRVKVYGTNQSNQRDRKLRKWSHLKKHLRMHRTTFRKICDFEFQYRKYFQQYFVFLSKIRIMIFSIFGVSLL